MKDIYRELAKRSIADAGWLAHDVAADHDIMVSEEMASQFAIALYQHRVQELRHKYIEAQVDEQFPDGTGGTFQ